MVNNTKLLISSALISSFLVGNIAIAKPSDSSEDEGTKVAVAKLNTRDFKPYSGLILQGDAAVDAYDKTRKAQNKALKRAGGPGTLYPEERGAWVQKAGRAAWATTKFAAAVAYPILETAIVRAGMNVVVAKAIPYVADKGAELVAAASHLPGAARSAVKAVVEGELLRDGVYLAGKVEPWVLPVVKTGYTIGKGVAKLSYATGKAAVSGLSKAYSWFTGTSTATAAEAA
jgi:hypothetical protein